MTNSKFIRSIVIDIIVYVALLVIIFAIASAVTPIISNDMFLEQMENSDDAYIMMSTYNRILPLFKGLYAVVTLLFGYMVIRDIYDYFIKNKKEKN